MFAPENLDVTIPLLEMMQVEDFDGVRARLIRVLMNRQAKAAKDMEAAQQASSEAMQVEAQKNEAQAQGKQSEIQSRADSEQRRGEIELEKARIQASTQIQIALINAQARGQSSPMNDMGMEQGGDMEQDDSEVPSLFDDANEYEGEPTGEYEYEGSEMPEALSPESVEAIAQAIGTQYPAMEPQYADMDPVNDMGEPINEMGDASDVETPLF
jgi:hypothetical protein